MVKSVGQIDMRLAHHLLRHPSGVFQFRQIVPADLQALLGRRVIKQSLRTRDPTDQWVKLKEEADTLHRHVQDLKQAGRIQQADLVKLDQEGRALDEQISEHQRSVDAAMSEIQAADLGWAKMLVATTGPEERQWIELVTPPASSVIEAPVFNVMQPAERMEIAMRPPARRMRP